MAAAAQYAEWLQGNQDKKGTDLYNRAIEGYKIARSQDIEPPTEKPKEDGYDPLTAKNIAGAAIEPNLALLSGGPAFMASGLAGAGAYATNAIGLTDTPPADVVRAIQERFTYQPRTEGGKRATEAITYPFRKLDEFGTYVGETSAETTGSPAYGAIAKAITEAPAILAGGRLARGMKAEVPADASLARRALPTLVGAPVKAAKAVGSGVKNLVEPILIPGGTRHVAGRALNEVTGPHREAVIDALQKAKEGETAGQAATGSGSHEFAALQKLAERHDPSKYGAIKEAQMAQRMAALRETGKTPGDLALAMQERKANAGENYGQVAADRIDPRSNAQVLSEVAKATELKAIQAEMSKAAAMKDWGRFKTLEAQSQALAKGNPPITGRLREQSSRDGQPRPIEPNMTYPPRYAGGVIAPERYAPQKPLQAQAGVAAAEAQAIAGKRLTKMQGLENAQQTMLVNMVGETSAPLAKFLSRPSVQKAIKSARESAAETGSYFPKEGENFSIANLQRIKRAIADDIKVKQREGSLGATEFAEVGKTLDSFNNWIKSKSEGFKFAEEQFAAESVPINRMKVMQVLMEGLEPIAGSRERAAKFMNAVLQGEKTVKSATGREIPMSEIFNSEQMATINKVVGEMKRDALLKEQSITGTPAMKQQLETAIPEYKPPGLLDRTMFIMRAVLQRIHGKASKGTIEYITEKMNDPKEIARIMEEATPTEKVVLDNYLKARNQSLVSGAIAATENQ